MNLPNLHALPAPTFVLDCREWRGGIGRFRRETVPYLPPHEVLTSRWRPTHALAPAELAYSLRRATLPFFSPGYLPPLASRMPAIVTLHDLMYLPGHTVASPARATYMNAIKPLLRRCATIVTMSDAARDAAAEWLGGGVDIVAVGGGVSTEYSPAPSGRPAATVLYVGSRAPNKNIAGLLGGFARSRHAEALLVTGTEHDWAAAVAAAGIGAAAARIRYLGYVDEADLPDVYRQAAVLLMPSLEEGYGLPAVEAMATGVPVVYGTDAAMTEIVGDAGLSVDPHDHAALGAAVDALLADGDRAAALAATGLERAARCRWPDVAERIAAVIRAAI